MTGKDGFEGTRKEMERAIRRLNVLEYFIIAAAFLLALAGGGVVAYLLSGGTDVPFRLTWALISLAALIIPGSLVFGRDLLKRRERGSGSRSSESQIDGG